MCVCKYAIYIVREEEGC